MTPPDPHAAAFTKLAKAAAAGDQAARDALDTLAKTAETVVEPAGTAAERGRAEARRRFGTRPEDPA